MEQLQQTTIHDLPVEILEKVINPFCAVDKLVCRLWNDVSNELYDLNFKKHKECFKPSLDEICSIRYELVTLRDDYAVIFYYPVQETDNDDLVVVRAREYISIRQYKNKVAKVSLKTKLVLNNKLIVNKIDMVKYQTQTLYYDYVDDLDNIFRNIRAKVLPGENHYQYDIRFTKSYGVPDEMYNLVYGGPNKKIQYHARCIIEKMSGEKYGKYLCLLKIS
ncbi:hypothetical protein PV-S19_0400 [Pacmanvirus S19]|nr:hypothetical protein PV-S19_0400 [Pacmanvirus S19]